MQTVRSRNKIALRRLRFGDLDLANRALSFSIHEEIGRAEITCRLFIHEDGAEIRRRLLDLQGFIESFELSYDKIHLTTDEMLLDSCTCGGEGQVYGVMLIFQHDASMSPLRWC